MHARQQHAAVKRRAAVRSIADQYRNAAVHASAAGEEKTRVISSSAGRPCSDTVDVFLQVTNHRGDTVDTTCG
jgi:hypothetical protein